MVPLARPAERELQGPLALVLAAQQKDYYMLHTQDGVAFHVLRRHKGFHQNNPIFVQ